MDGLKTFSIKLYIYVISIIANGPTVIELLVNPPLGNIRYISTVVK